MENMKRQEKYILTLERAHPYQQIHTYIPIHKCRISTKETFPQSLTNFLGQKRKEILHKMIMNNFAIEQCICCKNKEGATISSIYQNAFNPK